MRALIIFSHILFFVISAHSQPQKDISTAKKQWHVFSEVDMGIALFTGGLAANAGFGYSNYRLSAGFSRFDAPSKTFSGVPDGFKLRVNYLFAVNLDYFISQDQANEGLYFRLMYHNKQQYVKNKATGDSKLLDSQLLGLETGYVWKFYKCWYVAPRIGALYYLKSPQGSDNKPVLIGDAWYNNGRHKVWDTYFIPTISLGYSF